MHEDEHGYPIVPHEVAMDAKRHGCLMADERGYIADLMLGAPLLNEIDREDTETLAKERLAQLG